MRDDLSALVAAVMTSTAPGVVRVGRGLGRGAGFVLGEGLVATNAHNVRGDRVTVSFADERRAVGELAGLDADGDIAVIAVDTAGSPPLPWSESPPAIGEIVVAVTHDAIAGVRATLGRVSAHGAAFRSPRGRLVGDALEHTAPLARGSSGGPLFDGDGKLVAVNTHRRGDGFYLALPASGALRDKLGALATGATPSRPRLGVAVAPPEIARRMREAVGLPPRDGLLVRGVEDGGPADAAGIRRGDLLVEAGGRALTTSDELFAVLDAAEPGGRLALTVVRGTDEIAVEVTLTTA